MPINIRMKHGFMYLGDSPTNTDIEVPMPFDGDSSGEFSSNFDWQMQQSADGSIVGQQLGRSKAAQEMTWERMDCQTWWTLNNWIETNGMSFYARFFNFNLGVWQTRRFYVQKVACKPYRPAGVNSPIHGQPLYLKDCTLTVYDQGVVE